MIIEKEDKKNCLEFLEMYLKLSSKEREKIYYMIEGINLFKDGRVLNE